MFRELQVEILDEIILQSSPKEKPGVHIRLGKTSKGNLVIQSWSENLNENGAWTNMYKGEREYIENIWNSWKRIKEGIDSRKK